MNMQARGRVAVVTGASSGVGKAAAKLLAAQGWQIIAQGRDPARSAAAEAEIRATAPQAKVTMLVADLALLGDAARLAGEIAALTPRINALLANAGGVRSARLITAEGNEATFAGNHLGHFLMVERLMPQLRAAAAQGPGMARVISTSSTGHAQADPIDWNDLQLIEKWESGRAYCQAKLCNILFTRELARRAAADGIVAHAMHPGLVDSNFAAHAVPAMQGYMATLDLQPPELSAGTLAWLAGADEPGQVSGRYYHDYAELAPSAMAQDEALAARLWAESERLIARAGV